MVRYSLQIVNISWLGYIFPPPHFFAKFKFRNIVLQRAMEEIFSPMTLYIKPVRTGLLEGHTATAPLPPTSYVPMGACQCLLLVPLVVADNMNQLHVGMHV